MLDAVLCCVLDAVLIAMIMMMLLLLNDYFFLSLASCSNGPEDAKKREAGDGNQVACLYSSKKRAGTVRWDAIERV